MSYDDDYAGPLEENVDLLRRAVVGRKIVSVAQGRVRSGSQWGGQADVTLITLDDGRVVKMEDTSDCCAYTALEEFLLHPEMVEHAITGVHAEDGHTRWRIFADGKDILELTVCWSPGNPFYYHYGFDIYVSDPNGEVVL